MYQKELYIEDNRLIEMESKFSSKKIKIPIILLPLVKILKHQFPETQYSDTEGIMKFIFKADIKRMFKNENLKSLRKA